ncbi:transposase [Sporomusa carbonis]|uniref:transposase n=1 Tax=Sporomusa carbonis TaxID=3076075 RepID=UPI003C7C31E1
MPPYDLWKILKQRRVEARVCLACYPQRSHYTGISKRTILEYYSQRWPLEIFFRQTKGNFGFNKYQVRSAQAIDRIMVLITLTYLWRTT